jgi:signal peptidase II
MLKKYSLYIALFVSLFILDQYIKFLFVDGFRLKGECISLVLTYNTGVAFSMLAFLKEYLKFIQLVIIFFSIIYLYLNKDIFKQYILAITFIFAGGLSNIFDRFIHEGVVDYVYWHCGFNFAIFNLADVLIDMAIVIILFINYKGYKKIKLK